MHYCPTAVEWTVDQEFQDTPTPKPATDTTIILMLLCVFKQHNLFQTCMNPNNWIENSIVLVHIKKHNVSHNYSLPFNNATFGELKRNIPIFEEKYISTF